MNKGKILKVRPGHDANCSGMAYMGGVLIGMFGHGLLLMTLIPVQIAVRWKWKLRTRIALWVVPHLVAIAVLLVWGFRSGAMEYGSLVFVWGLVILMLIALAVGWGVIAARHKAPARASDLCPRCGRCLRFDGATTGPEAELFQVVMGPRATPAEVAPMPLENLTATVA
jgi:hypothetical protein